MNDPIELLSRKLAAISLEPQKRDAMRHRLHAFVLANPVRPPALAFFVRHAAASSVAAIVLLAGATTGFASKAMPDDFLYPLRVAVTDPLSVAIAGDADARMDRELELIARSIDDEELAGTYALADIAVEVDGSAEVVVPSQATAGSDAQADAGWDAGLEAELHAIDRMLDDEETGANLELSL